MECSVKYELCRGIHTIYCVGSGKYNYIVLLNK